MESSFINKKGKRERKSPIKTDAQTDVENKFQCEVIEQIIQWKQREISDQFYIEPLK